MFWNLFLVEQSKLFRRRFFRLEVAILALLTVIVHAGLIVFLHRPEAAASGAVQFQGSIPDTPHQLLIMVTGLFTGGANLMGLLIISFVAAFVAQEYTWRTVHLWLSRGVSRRRYLLAKASTVLLALLILLITPLVVSIPFVFYTVPQAGGVLSMAPGDLQIVATTIARALFVLLPYAALALFLSVATRSPLAAGGTAMGISVIAEPLLNLAGALNTQVRAVLAFLPRNLAQIVMNASAPQLAQQGSAEGALLSPATATVTIGAWVVVFLALTFWQFRRQDIT